MAISTIDRPAGAVADQPARSALDSVRELAAKTATRRDAAARRFLLTFAGTFVLGVLAIAAFSVYINPWGTFGRTGRLDLYNARLMKAEYLAALPRDKLPQAIVLGSSNVMRYNPQTIERLWGLSAFNFGVFWGGADDFYCITRYLLDDLQHKPKLLILGVDPWTLTTTAREHPVFPGMPRRLLNAGPLVRHHSEINAVSLQWARVVDLFSGQHVSASWKAWRDPRRPRLTMAPLLESGQFDASGMRTRYPHPITGRSGGDVLPAVEMGKFPIDAIVAGQIAGGPTGSGGLFYRLYDVTALDAQRVRRLEDTVRLCDAAGIHVAFVINPIHPLLRDELSQRRGYRTGITLVRAELERLRRLYPTVKGLVDASDLAAIGGDSSGFYDAMHPATRNCDRILAKLAEEMPTLP
jgi:hypothetical protein